MLNTERSYEINWKITCYRDDYYFPCCMWKYEPYTKIQQLVQLLVVQQAICLVVMPQPHLGGAALGGVIGSQVNKGGDYDDREYRHHKNIKDITITENIVIGMTTGMMINSNTDKNDRTFEIQIKVRSFFDAFKFTHSTHHLNTQSIY